MPTWVAAREYHYSLAGMVTCVFSLPGHSAVLAGEGTDGAVRADRRHGHDDLGALFDGLGAPVGRGLIFTLVVIDED